MKRQRKDNRKPFASASRSSSQRALGLYETDVSAQLQLMGLGGLNDDMGIWQQRSQTWKEIEREHPLVAACRNLMIAGVMGDSIAKKSYFTLFDAGFREIEFLEMLVGMATSATNKIPRSQVFSGCGMNREQMRNFPKRIKRFAEEIDRLNKHPSIRPDIFIGAQKASEPLKKLLSRWLPQIPLLLRCYAVFFTIHTKAMIRNSTPTHKTYRPVVLESLISLVRKETGKPMFADLANVLTAAARAAGMSENGLDADSLKTLDAEYRNKAARGLA